MRTYRFDRRALKDLDDLLSDLHYINSDGEHVKEFWISEYNIPDRILEAVKLLTELHEDIHHKFYEKEE